MTGFRDIPQPLDVMLFVDTVLADVRAGPVLTVADRASVVDFFFIVVADLPALEKA